MRRASPGQIALEGVRIRRRVSTERRPFLRYFRGFEKLASVRAIFGARTREVLRKLEVEFNSFRWGYMGVSSDDGHLFVSTYYLAHGRAEHIYLDVIHELVHVRQHMEGKELFDESFQYADRPTEVEAYAHTVAEARRIGLSDAEIFEYLKTEWMSAQEHRRLAARLGVAAG